jgi:hypothetical protein
MTISQPEANEQEISLWVQVAIERLEKVDSDAKEKKTQIVKDLAKNLEGKIPTDRIANEIVHQLRGKVSERLIHSCLEKKYKEKYRVENAQKRKKKREVTAESAAPLLLEQEKPQQLMVAVTEEGKSVTIDETSKNREASISKRTRTDDNSEAEAPAINQTKSVSFDEQTPYMKTDINGTSLVAIEKLAQNRSGKGSESDLEKCPKCSVLRLHNQELEEALRKTTTLSTADTLYSLEISKDHSQ